MQKQTLINQETKKAISKLVEHFSQASKNKDYINSQSEENIKNHYIEPLLEALGWTRWDMNKEERILKDKKPENIVALMRSLLETQ